MVSIRSPRKTLILKSHSCVGEGEEEVATTDMTRVHPQLTTEAQSEKKLRRLPQVFSRVLELPFPREANVGTYFAPDADHFVVPRGIAGQPNTVKVRIVSLEPRGITRVVVHIGPGEPDLEDNLVYDKWRFRLDETSIPSMTLAGYVNGNLVVIVPRRVADNSLLNIPMCLDKGIRGGGKYGQCGCASFVHTQIAPSLMHYE